MTTTPTLRDAAQALTGAIKGSPTLEKAVDEISKDIGAALDGAPVAWGIWDSQGFYESTPDEGSARRFCNRYNAREGDPLKPYICAPLFTHRAALAAPADALAEPVGYLEWFDGKPVWGEGCVCSDPVWPTFPGDGDESTSMPIYTATQLQQAVARALAEQREKIAQGWDGCMYDAVGETVDIGADIRRGGQQ